MDVTDLYDALAPHFDAVYGGDEHEVAFLLRHLGPPGTVLEVGIGTGRVGLRLAQAGWRVVGVDASEQMLRRAADRLGPLGLADRVELVHAALADFDDGRRFPVCVAVGLFFHLPDAEAYRAALRHAYRLLAPGGRFFCDVEHRGTGHGDRPGHAPAGPCRLVVRHDPGSMRGEATYTLGAATPAARQFRSPASRVTVAEMERLAGDAGFDVLGSWGGFADRPVAESDREFVVCLGKRP